MSYFPLTQEEYNLLNYEALKRINFYKTFTEFYSMQWFEATHDYGWSAYNKLDKHFQVNETNTKYEYSSGSLPGICFRFRNLTGRYPYFSKISAWSTHRDKNSLSFFAHEESYSMEEYRKIPKIRFINFEYTLKVSELKAMQLLKSKIEKDIGSIEALKELDFAMHEMVDPSPELKLLWQLNNI